LLDKLEQMFHVCSQAAAEGEGRVSGSIEAVPPAAACKRSVGAQLAARAAKAGLEELIVGLSSRGASAASVVAQESLTAKRVRREMAPQRLEKVQFAPGNGMAPAPRVSGIGARGDHRPEGSPSLLAGWPTRRATRPSRQGGRKSLKVAQFGA
jgi:hypothetical protein